jgi:TonB C terminal
MTRSFIESDPHRTAMLGRYMGQINARIERAWIRPRTSVESGQFACRAKITQAKNGAVLEIELQDCNGDGRWQASLAHAIESASPLPAPPDPEVFSRVVILDLTALPFSQGGDSTGFEPELRSAMN